MGLVNGGVPREFVALLGQVSGASVFVETGTFQGTTTRWAAERFATVHTIEMSDMLYEQYHGDLESMPNIQTHLGNSALVLPEIVKNLGDERAIYWLDGHWSGNETAGEDDECPLLSELDCLVSRPRDLILIDDARLFLCAPPKPHKPEHWPTLKQILDVFSVGPERLIQVIDDVIYLVPQEPAIVDELIRHAQNRSADQAAGPKFRSIKRIAQKIGL